MPGITSVYVDADTFTVASDRTADFIVGRRVSANCGVDGYKYGTIESSSYSSPNTTVNLASTNDDLTLNLAEVWYSSVKPGPTGNVSRHTHAGDEGDGYSVGRYSVDHNETDQGAAGEGKSIKTFVDAIGSDSATIQLRHNSGSATTTYTLTTNVTIPSNITLEIENGAVIDGAGTLTINGFIEAGVYQILGSNITIIGDLQNGTLFPQWCGVTGDGVTDDSASIQKIVDISEAAGGRSIFFSVGAYVLSSTITIDNANVKIIGSGCDSLHDLVPASGIIGTRFEWDGAANGTMMEVKSIEGATLRNKVGSGVRAVSFDGNGTAGIGLKVRSIQGGLFEDIYIKECTDQNLYLGVVTTLGEVKDLQFCSFNRIHLNNLTATGDLLRLDGDNSANVSLNSFRNLRLRHNDGDGIIMINADANVFRNTLIYRHPGGTGTSLEFRGGVSVAESARNNLFMGLTSTAAPISKGTGTYTVGAHNNIFVFYDVGNSSPAPTIETGSTLYFHYSSNVAYHGLFNQAVIGDTHNTIQTEEGNLSTASLRIHNNASNHIALTNGTEEWLIRIDSATGDLLLTRISGTGSFVLPASATEFGADGLVTVGANDSGGAGYKVLRVPN